MATIAGRTAALLRAETPHGAAAGADVRLPRASDRRRKRDAILVARLVALQTGAVSAQGTTKKDESG
jgi:hypothetical protein